MKRILKYLDDILLGAGIVVIAYGLYLIFLPLGYIAIGAGLITFAHLMARA